MRATLLSNSPNPVVEVPKAAFKVRVRLIHDDDRVSEWLHRVLAEARIESGKKGKTVWRT
jgi:hypothetical protein